MTLLLNLQLAVAISINLCNKIAGIRRGTEWNCLANKLTGTNAFATRVRGLFMIF